MNPDTPSDIVANAAQGPSFSNAESFEEISCFPAFGIPLILKEIFKQLTTADLLRCSLVNKMWNYEARNFLREFKKCTVATKSWRPCADLLEFNALLESVRNSPFNGLTFNIAEDNHETDTCIPAENVEQLYSIIVNKITLKYLAINWRWQMYDDEESLQAVCPAVEFLKKIFVTKVKEVEELNLIELYIPSDHQPFSSDFDLRRHCGILTTLKVMKLPRVSLFPRNFIRNLISVSPNLKEFGSEVASSRDVRYLSPDRFNILRRVKIEAFNTYDQELWLSFARSRPTLRYLDINFLQPSLSSPNIDLISFPTWLDSIQQIFASSEKSLEVLHCDLTILMMLMDMSGLPTFINVTRLKVDVNFTHEEHFMFRKFDFDRFFPKLTSISMHIVPLTPRQWLLDLCQYVQSVNVSLMPDVKSERIKSLELSVENFHTFDSSPQFVRHTIQFSGEIFPAVEHLSLLLPEGRPVFGATILTPYDQIWTSMPNLETIKMCIFNIENSTNYDFSFCGIHPEEAKYLQAQDDTFLKEVHITPIRPSITCLKKLRKLELSLRGHNSWNSTFEEEYLSKAVGFIALSRVPNLEMTLRTSTGNSAVMHGLSNFVKCLPLDPHEPVNL